MAIKKDTLDQLLAGRDPREVFNKDGLFDELKKALAERLFERRDRRSSRRRGDGGQTQQSQRLFEEDGADRDFEARSADSPRSRGDVRSEADPALSTAVSGLRREDCVDVRARHDGSRDPGPSAEALWPGGRGDGRTGSSLARG